MIMDFLFTQAGILGYSFIICYLLGHVRIIAYDKSYLCRFLFLSCLSQNISIQPDIILFVIRHYFFVFYFLLK